MLWLDSRAIEEVEKFGGMARAIEAGIPANRIVFSGVGKTRDEMRLALTGGIRQFNVESEPELRALSEVATSLGVTAPITIRVNPDVDAKTHAKIATGKSENKFGIPLARAGAAYALAANTPGIRAMGPAFCLSDGRGVDCCIDANVGISHGSSCAVQWA